MTEVNVVLTDAIDVRRVRPADPELLRFAFTGHAGEYFRIWIVSLCLSIATLGIYSAWGKVRKKRYLYAHTELDGSSFDYRASPLAILRGRILALLLFGGFALSAHFVPVLQIAFIALLVVLTPMIVVAAARFNARNTTYRNIAFVFDGKIGEAARVFIGGIIIVVLTGGLAYPFFRARRARYIIAHHGFGATPFSVTLETRKFFQTYFLGGLIVVGAAAVAGFAGSSSGGGTPITALLYLALVYLSYIVAYAYIRARTLNLMADGTSIGAIRLHSTLRARRLAWIYASNIVAILASVGLATPWAMIRVARYRVDNLVARSTAPLETYASRPSRSNTATGSEVSDLFDVDVSL